MTHFIQPTFQRTLLTLIDDPAQPARETMDEHKFAELVASVRKHGIIEPIILTPVGDRFMVVAGHRRTMAAREAQLVDVPTMLYPNDPQILDVIKLHENTKREDLNPGEEAVWFAQLLEKIPGGDTDALAELVDETRDYVETRLNLLRGDEFVLDALKRGQIALGVAEELNTVKNVATRRDWLQHAVSQGASRKTVKNWRKADEAMQELNPGQAMPAAESSVEAFGPRRSPMACLLCGQDHDTHLMLYVYLHRHCLQFFEKHIGVRLLDFFADQPHGEPPKTQS